MHNYNVHTADRSTAPPGGTPPAPGPARHWPSSGLLDQLRHANLTQERERSLLATLRQSQDPQQREAAFRELWESHAKLVVAIARRYRRQGQDLLDLVGAGHLGLHAAIERFDPERFQTRLSSYAIGWIRWTIQDYIRRNSGPVRLPGSAAHRQLLQMGSRLLADARRCCERERVEPTEGELCERVGRRIGLTGSEVANSLRLIQSGSVSLHNGGDAANGAGSLAETLADASAGSEDDVILRLDHAKARKRIISLADEILGERERAVFFARCMNDSDEVARLSSIAAQLGVSPERVCQLEASAKRKIATALAHEGYTDFARPGEPIRLPQVRARRRTAAAPRPSEALRLASGAATS